MATKRKRAKQTSVARALEFSIRQRHIQIILDKVLFLRFLRNLHGRFWGLAGILFMLAGFTVCFAIRPDMIHISTAFSDFGADVRTAPYFTGSVFFAAYGMWRWQQYLRRTWKRPRPIGGLMVLTVLGLYIIALMPVSWNPWPHRIHMFGVILAGTSMLATVVLDWLLTKPRAGKYALQLALPAIHFTSVYRCRRLADIRVCRSDRLVRCISAGRELAAGRLPAVDSAQNLYGRRQPYDTRKNTP